MTPLASLRLTLPLPTTLQAHRIHGVEGAPRLLLGRHPRPAAPAGRLLRHLLALPSGPDRHKLSPRGQLAVSQLASKWRATVPCLPTWCSRSMGNWSSSWRLGWCRHSAWRRKWWQREGATPGRSCAWLAVAWQWQRQGSASCCSPLLPRLCSPCAVCSNALPALRRWQSAAAVAVATEALEAAPQSSSGWQLWQAAWRTLSPSTATTLVGVAVLGAAGCLAAAALCQHPCLPGRLAAGTPASLSVPCWRLGSCSCLPPRLGAAPVAVAAAVWEAR